MRYLVNYKPIEGEYLFEDILPRVEIMDIGGKVWDTLPIGFINPMNENDELYLNPNGELINRQEGEKITRRIKENSKLYKFSLDENGKLYEDEEGKIMKRLPLDVKVEHLEYINDEVLLFVEDKGDE